MAKKSTEKKQVPNRAPTVNPNNIKVPSFGMLPPNPKSSDPNVREIVFWEEGNPNCVLNLVHDLIAEQMRELPPHILGLNEKDIEKQLKPNYQDEQYRIAFWDEYFIAIDNGKKMRLDPIFARTSSREAFAQAVKNPLRLAYMLQPPRDYMLQVRSLLNVGLSRFDEILRMNVVKPSGEVDTRLIAEMVKIVTIMDNRAKGAVVQKIQLDTTQKTFNINANYEPPKTHQEVENEIKEMEREIMKLKNPMQMIEDISKQDIELVRDLSNE